MSPIQQILLGAGGAKADPVYIDNVFDTHLWVGNGDPKTINNGLAFASGLSLPLGTYIQGGYYQGTFTDNSVDYALIVAPNGTGNNNGNYKTYGSSSTASGATSLTNGPSNTATLAAAGGDWPAADWAYALSLNGYSDWYLPAKDELTLLYQNSSTLPSGQAWDTSFDTWSSTEINSTYAWMIYMSSGTWSNTDNKTKTRLVRAIRRVTVASLSDYQVTGQGGMVWIKRREGATDHALFDTERGATKHLAANTQASQATNTNSLTSFNPTGFSIDDNALTGSSTDTYVAWSFRNCPGFFSCVSWTGNGSGSRQISHSLESVPGAIIIKNTSNTSDWIVWHRSLDTSSPEDYYLKLNAEDHRADDYTIFNDQAPTSTYFVVGTDSNVNANGQTYVAYVFAHNDARFGPNQDQSIIKCGEYTGNGSTTDGTEVNLGWQPQYLIQKRLIDNNQPWNIFDTMRGFSDDGSPFEYTTEYSDVRLRANTDNGDTVGPYFKITPTGFKAKTAGQSANSTNHKFVYIAIRFPDGNVTKPITSGSDVLSLATGTNNTNPGFVSGFPVDFSLRRPYASGSDWYAASRLTGINYLIANEANAQDDAVDQTFNFQNGIGKWGSNLTSWMSWNWKRHAGFDVVVYPSDNVSGRAISHGLGKTPEMIWFKRRTSVQWWGVWHKGLNNGVDAEDYHLVLNNSNAESNSGSPLSNAPSTTQFFVANSSFSNAPANHAFLAVLFASVDGISKVGYYTGNGTGASSTQTITLGFQPRFLIVKKADGTNHWAVFDTTRGWGSGTNDAVLELNENGAQSTGFGDVTEPTSTGFIVRNNYGMINTNNSNYIYYAHA